MMPKVAFGSDEIEFELEPGDNITEMKPHYAGPDWQAQTFFHRLKKNDFGNFLKNGKLLTVVNDAFRSTPTDQILYQLQEHYPDFKSDFIIACGNHPPPNKSELAKIFYGYQLPDDARIFFHDSGDFKSLTLAGKIDEHGIYLNSHLFDYPAVLIIGSVEPHYFAGYTGGRKSLIPGLSDIETNRRNHALAVSQEARPTRLKGNPVAEDLERLLNVVDLPPIFSIQIVAGRDKDIINCFCGSLQKSFEEATAMAEMVYSVRSDKMYDLVIAEMKSPLDRNLYQIQKGIENCASVVRDGGTILVVSPCRDGIGNEEFYHLANELQNEEMVLSQAAMDNPPLGIHKLSRMVELSKRISVRVMTGLKREIIEQVFLEPVVSITAEIQKLRGMPDDKIDILLVHDGGLLVAKMD